MPMLFGKNADAFHNKYFQDKDKGTKSMGCIKCLLQVVFIVTSGFCSFPHQKRTLEMHSAKHIYPRLAKIALLLFGCLWGVFGTARALLFHKEIKKQGSTNIIWKLKTHHELQLDFPHGVSNSHCFSPVAIL